MTFAQANKQLDGTGFQIARTNYRRYCIAREHGNKWEVQRENGVAFGSTPHSAVTWAYADGGTIAETFATLAEVQAAISEASEEA